MHGNVWIPSSIDKIVTLCYIGNVEIRILQIIELQERT